MANSTKIHGINSEKMWADEITRILGDLCSCYQTVNPKPNCFQTITEFSNIKIEPLFFSDSTDITKRNIIICRKFEELSNAFIKLLSTSSSISVCIPLSAILNFIAKICLKNVRISVVHSSNVNFERNLLVYLTPIYQINSLRMLDILITICKTNLVVHSQFIIDILIHILEKTNGHSEDLILRNMCYKVFANYFSTLGSLSQIQPEKNIDLFMGHITKDINNKKKIIKLQHNKRNKNGKIISPTEMDKKLFEDMHNDESSMILSCIKALNALLTHSISWLPTSLHNRLASLILEQALAVYRGDGSKIYIESALCRNALLDTLCSLSIHPSGPPISATLIVFDQAATLDKCELVRLKANQSKNMLSCLANPRRAIEVISINRKEIGEINDTKIEDGGVTLDIESSVIEKNRMEGKSFEEKMEKIEDVNMSNDNDSQVVTQESNCFDVKLEYEAEDDKKEGLLDSIPHSDIQNKIEIDLEEIGIDEVEIKKSKVCDESIAEYREISSSFSLNTFKEGMISKDVMEMLDDFVDN